MKKVKIDVSPMTPSEIPDAAKFFKTEVLKMKTYTPKARQLWINAYSTRHLKKKLSDGYIHTSRNTAMLYRIDGKIAGLIFAWFEDGGIVRQDWILVSPKYRGHGIGSKLQTSFEKAMKRRGVHKIVLDSQTTNKDAVEFFKKHDFKKIGTARKHWFKQNYHFMAKTIK